MNSTKVYETSYLKGLADRARSVLATSYDWSRLGRSIDQVVQFVRQSYLFQWLTAEPEPDVVVIDLRETVTVGPFLALLDRFVPVAARSWRESRLRALGAATEQRFKTQPLRLSSIVLVVALAVNTLLTAVTETVAPVDFGLRLAVLLLALVGTQMRHSWAELTETQAYALAVALLEPPEAPADDEETDSGSDDPSRRR